MWYIDSWAVLDGLAFASERESDSSEAKATVFLSVPDLEPIPVGRLSTALRAQRASFQDGFRDDDGHELGLDTLEQVRDLVRRAYLGGDLGPEPAPLEARPLDPLLVQPVASERRVGPWPSGGSHYADELLEYPRHDTPGREMLRRTDFGDLQSPKSRRALLQHLYGKGHAVELYPLLRAFGEATILELLREQGDHIDHPDRRSLLRNWVSILWTLGVWNADEEHHFLAYLKQYGLDVSGLDWHWRSQDFILASAWARKEILFHVPCPLLPLWYPHFGTLSHKLLLALTIKDYFDHNRDLPEFIPVLLCSLVFVAGPNARFTGSDQRLDADRQRLLGRAFLWLVNELPSVELPDKVEFYLSRYAIEQLAKQPAREL